MWVCPDPGTHPSGRTCAHPTGPRPSPKPHAQNRRTKSNTKKAKNSRSADRGRAQSAWEGKRASPLEVFPPKGRRCLCPGKSHVRSPQTAAPFVPVFSLHGSVESSAARKEGEVNDAPLVWRSPELSVAVWLGGRLSQSVSALALLSSARVAARPLSPPHTSFPCAFALRLAATSLPFARRAGATTQRLRGFHMNAKRGNNMKPPYHLIRAVLDEVIRSVFAAPPPRAKDSLRGLPPALPPIA